MPRVENTDDETKADKYGDIKADKFYGDLEAIRNAEMKAVEMETEAPGQAG
jgi:hypothetical protein